MAKCEYFRGDACKIGNIDGCSIYKQFESEIIKTQVRGEPTDHIPNVGERALMLGEKYNCPLLGKMGDKMLEKVEALCKQK